MQPGLISWGKAILCAMDVETTGIDDKQHEIRQIAMVPLTADLQPYDGLPFYTNIRPEYPERCNPNALAACGVTLEELDLAPTKFEAEEAFYAWHRSLELPHGYRLLPLWHNGKFDEPFIRNWLGPQAWDDIASLPARDTITVASAINDRAAFECRPLPFARMRLEVLAHRLGVPTPASHDALADCLTTIAVYRGLINFPQ
jgi:DNA polymerase III epsilon subunit-like protein